MPESRARNPGGDYHDWPRDARTVVERAIDAHGGYARWQAINSITIDFGSAAGLLPWLKGYRRTFTTPRLFEIQPHRRTTIFHEYPDAGHRGIFVDGAVRLERVPDGGVVARSDDHRRTFGGLAKHRRWGPLDALYFFGYALWHYHAVPFTLGDAAFVRLDHLRGDHTRVTVDFPASVPTHGRRQRFFFDQTGRIVRHDYVADVIGRWARGCHQWLDYQDAEGFPIAHHRRVTARLFGHPTPVTVLDVHLGAAVVA